MLWLADEFLAQVPDGDPVNDVVTALKAYTPAAGSVIQAVTDSAGPSEQAKNAFGRWAGSVSNGRSRVGPMRGLDPDYVSEFASLGFVGKEVGPRVYARWEQDGSPGDYGSWLALEDGRRALIGETIMDSSVGGLALLMKRADAPEGSPTRHAFAAISVESLRGDASLPAEEFYRQGGFA
jgi:hypothetical protein